MVCRLQKTVSYVAFHRGLLGPLLFLIYITDLPNCLEHSLRRSFADDTNVTLSAEDLPTLQTEMSDDLNRMFDWLNPNKLPLNIQSENRFYGDRSPAKNCDAT